MAQPRRRVMAAAGTARSAVTKRKRIGSQGCSRQYHLSCPTVPAQAAKRLVSCHRQDPTSGSHNSVEGETQIKMSTCTSTSICISLSLVHGMITLLCDLNASPGQALAIAIGEADEKIQVVGAGRWQFAIPSAYESK